MPGFLTHYIAGQAALQGIDPAIRKIITPGEKLYNLGTQGPDIFFYYMPGHLRKRSRGLGGQMHQNDLGVFFMRMAELAKASSPRDRDILFAYIAGYIMHYALDANAHPYVYARTHHDNVPKIKNSADHRKFETAIDIAMLNLVSGKKPADYSQWELIKADYLQMLVAAEATSRAVYSVYDRDVPPKAVHKAMRYMVLLTRLLQSRKGRRKRWMELVENLTVKEPIFSSMVHLQEVNDGNDYLNTQKTPWHAPWEEPGELHTDSFVERYHNAVEEGEKMVESLFHYIYNGLELPELSEIIGNRSLKTGMPCGH